MRPSNGSKGRLSRALLPLARRGETAVERLFVRKGATPVIEPYLGYASPAGVVLRGRVLTALRRSDPAPEQSRWTNLRQMAQLFATHEVAGVPVEAGGVSAVTGPEGYFTLTVPADDLAPGWVTVPGRLPGTGERADLPALIAAPEAVRGVISDIDDTVMQTGAYSLARNLWTTFTGSALTREVFPDMVALLAALHGGVNPVFYVSSSPWNLHHFLESIFARAGLVRGPMFLRDLGVSDRHLIAGTHGDHKGGAIDTILAANPGLPFVLLGDTGQHDAEVYFHAAERHPGRIERVFLRAPGPGADERDKAYADKLAALGVPVEIRPEFEGVEV